MSNDTEKTLEVKIRPYSNPNTQERPDQKGASRVHLCRDAMLDLKLESGQVCYIWKAHEPEKERRQAIAWLTSEKSLSRKVIQVSKSFQDACGFKLGDDVKISAGGPSEKASSIALREITAQEIDAIPELTDEDKHYWEWFLRESLLRAEIVFPRMTFKNISLRGPKRTFIIESVNDGYPYSLGQYSESTKVMIISGEKKNASVPTTFPSGKLEVVDVAGIDQALAKLNDQMDTFVRSHEWPRADSEWADSLNAVLLHGGHGTGKTFLLKKIAKTKWGKVFEIGRDAKPADIKGIFKKAMDSSPSIIIIDDLENLVSDEVNSTGPSNQHMLGEMMDELSLGPDGCERETAQKVFVAAATRSIGKLNLNLKTIGRFTEDISLPVPDPAARKAILKSLDPPFDPTSRDDMLDKLGDSTHAYTASDLRLLIRSACAIARKELDHSIPLVGAKILLTQDHLDQALSTRKPSAMHDVTLKPPTVRWEDIGGQDAIKDALRQALEPRLLNPERVKRIGSPGCKGLLLYGPPGCSKTLCAQAIATESTYNFFAVKGAELLNMYVGESERAVRDLFARARSAKPSIVFFDEIESIGSARESGGLRNGVNVLTTLLNEMDGIESLEGVTVVAATNQPEALDLALLRPGRFDKLIYVPVPDFAGRVAILKIKQRKMDFADDVDIDEIARLTDGYSGAELVRICHDAGDVVIRKSGIRGEELQVHMSDLQEAIPKVKRQITPELLEGYRHWEAGTKGFGG